MSEESLKESYFNHGIVSLARVLRPQPNGYVCPICFDVFNDIKELSLEHVPPKSIEGKAICLTCKKCNSIAGHSIDYAMDREKKFNDFGVSNGEPYIIKLKYDDHVLNAKITWDKSSTKICVLPNQNDPAVIKEVSEKLSCNNLENLAFEINVSGRYRQHTANISYLKSAYLAAFSKFGYRWVFNPSTEVIRQQIRKPKIKIIDVARVFYKSDTEVEDGFYIVGKPFICLFVVIGKSGIFLPWIQKENNELYSWLKERRNKDKLINCKFIKQWSWPNQQELLLDQN